MIERISIYGSKKEVKRAWEVLVALPLTGSEREDRLIIQKAIDEDKLKATIIYDGNIVWSFDRLIKDFKTALGSKNSGYKLSDYLYKFFSLACGSIAHYDKEGWISVYPTKGDLKQFCMKNEFGIDILTHQPGWASDRQRICREMLNIIEEDKND